MKQSTEISLVLWSISVCNGHTVFVIRTENERQYSYKASLMSRVFLMKLLNGPSNAALWKSDEKYFQKWTWHIIETMSKLSNVSLIQNSVSSAL